MEPETLTKEETAVPLSGWLTRNIRPIMAANMIILLNVFIALAIYAPHKAQEIAKALQEVPVYVWGVIGSVTGIYSIGRTYEKTKGAA